MRLPARIFIFTFAPSSHCSFCLSSNLTSFTNCPPKVYLFTTTSEEQIAITNRYSTPRHCYRSHKRQQLARRRLLIWPWHASTSRNNQRAVLGWWHRVVRVRVARRVGITVLQLKIGWDFGWWRFWRKMCRSPKLCDRISTSWYRSARQVSANLFLIPLGLEICLHG